MIHDPAIIEKLYDAIAMIVIFYHGIFMMIELRWLCSFLAVADETHLSRGRAQTSSRPTSARYPPRRKKNSQLAAARRVAMKMGRRPRCSSVTYQFRYAPSSRLAGGPF
jgi:hypothetical protein